MALFSVIFGTVVLLSRPVRFSPTNGAEELEIQVAFAPGMRLDAMVFHGEALSRLVADLPEISVVFGRSGAEPEDVLHRASPEYKQELLTLRCILKRGGSAQKLIPLLTERVQTYIDDKGPPGLSFRIAYPEDPIETLLGLSSAYTLALKGKSPETVQTMLGSALDELAARSPGTQFTYRPSGNRPELSIHLKRDRSATAQISAFSVARTLQASTEGRAASRMELEGRPIDIRVKARLDENRPLETLEALPVNEGGQAPVFLGSLATLTRTEGAAALARLDRSDVVYIDGTPASGQGKRLVQVMQRASLEIPGLTYADDSAFSRYRQSLMFTVFLVILLLYFLMAAQFESYSLPILLMVSIPVALSGAGPALALVGSGLDSGSIVGLAVLFGLVVNNAIILFEVSKEQIDKGRSRVIAVYSGSIERLISVLTTTTTTLLALLPVIIAPLGATQRSMSAAMFGGIAASTFISLLVIPPLLVHYMPQFTPATPGGPHGNS